jgi:hypothetical protein
MKLYRITDVEDYVYDDNTSQVKKYVMDITVALDCDENDLEKELIKCIKKKTGFSVDSVQYEEIGTLDSYLKEKIMDRILEEITDEEIVYLVNRYNIKLGLY